VPEQPATALLRGRFRRWHGCGHARSTQAEGRRHGRHTGEEFADRFGGLRYDVGRNALTAGKRYDLTEHWEFDLEDVAWAESTGWSFKWRGECVAPPVSY
jgi:hypothetical protein